MRKRTSNTWAGISPSRARPSQRSSSSRSESGRTESGRSEGSRSDYYPNDLDRNDYSGARMGSRVDRDTNYDYESNSGRLNRDDLSEDRSYRYGGRQQDDIYNNRDFDRERGSFPHRNRQLDEDMSSQQRGNWDEDYNDRNFVGSRGTGRSNQFGGGDLYRDLDDDMDESYQRGYDFENRDHLSGLSGGYGRNSTRESIRSGRSGSSSSGRGGRSGGGSSSRR